MKKFSSLLKTAGAVFLTACLFSSATQAAPPKIPSDAVEYNGHSYYIYRKNFATWEEAKRFCESLGGHLAIVNNVSEDKFLFNYMKQTGNDSVYIGLTDAGHEGKWIWIDGTPLTYENWGKRTNEPNGETYENYVEYLSWAYPNGEWIDADGVSKNTGGIFSFFCEWDSPKQVTTSTSTNQSSAPNRVTVKGMGANRDSAIRDAARNAVENVVGVYIDARALSKDSELALDEVYTKSQGYVKNITVIDESYSGGTCNITANIEVDNNPDGQLMNRLSMIMMLNDPRISVIVLKENTTPPDHDNISESTMNERLVDLGFSHVVDANIVSNLQNAELLNNIYNGKTSLSGVGDNYGADYLVLGKSNVDVLPSSGASMGKADLSVKIIKFDTGDIIGVFSVEGQGAEKIASYAERKALKSASQEAAKKLEEKFKKLSAAPVQGVQIFVTTSNYANLERLSETLKSLNDVQNVRIREYRNGRAILEIETTQNSNALLQLLQSNTTLKFSVEELSAASMKLVIL